MTNRGPYSMFDQYSLKARLWPALIAGIPAAAVVTVLLPGNEWWHAGLSGTGAAVGMTFFLAMMVRSTGKRKEPALFKIWRSKPTTRYLRHRGSPLDEHTLSRYHRNIARLVPELAIPTAEQEARDPNAADTAYEAATRVLINRTRDTNRFRLLFRENTHYGFCRNLWALTPAAVLIALASTMACGVLIYRSLNEFHILPPWPVVIGVVSLLWILLWIRWVTPEWVKVAADAYSERLLEASDDLAGELPPVV